MNRFIGGLGHRLREWPRVAALGPRYGALLLRVRRERLTYLDVSALLDLAHRVRDLNRTNIPGAVIEAGCALGGSAIVLAAGKEPVRPLYVYDVFGMIPPPSEVDGEDVTRRYREIESGKAKGLGGDEYYGYQEDLLDTVKQTFARLHVPPAANSIQFIKGEFNETLKLDEPIALAHVDCDWHDPVATCLERITPCLVTGGVIVIDDYDAWSGCRRAVDDFFRGRSGYRLEMRSRLHVVKVA